MSWAPYTMDSLIDNWGKSYEVCLTANEGTINDLGIYEEPEQEWTDDFGVLAVMTNNMLMPAEIGVYTSQDMYCITRSNYQIGVWIRDGTKLYKVHERADFSFFDQTNLFVYKIKRHDGRLDNSDD